MSPAEAAAEAAAAAARPSTAPPSQPRLAVVPPMPGRAPRAPFVLLVGALLTAGLGALLFLHTALAEDSFRLHDLQVRSVALTDRAQALEQLIDAEAAPQRLASRAAALGMVRSENPAFIRLSDGTILGTAKAGVLPPPPPAPATSATGPSATGPSATASPAAGSPTRSSPTTGPAGTPAAHR